MHGIGLHGIGLQDIGVRMDAAKRSQQDYDRHVAPIVVWALAEYGSRRAAHDALARLRNDNATSDLAFELLGRAIVALRYRLAVGKRLTRSRNR